MISTCMSQYPSALSDLTSAIVIMRGLEFNGIRVSIR